MILVTGATGLVGSHLLFELLKKGKKVRAFKRINSKVDDVKKVFGYYTPDVQEYLDRIEWMDGDITDKMSLNDAMEGIEEVYHTAAVVSFSSKDKYKVLEYNIEGTASIVDIALEKGIKKLCFVSSTAALGAPDENGRVDENSPGKTVKGQSVYSLSKFKSEMEVWRGITEGLDAVIVNPSIIIGPGNWQRSSSRMFHEIRKGLKFYTLGITGYVDIHDVVSSMIYLMESDISGEKFIISEGNYSYKDIFEKIADALGKKRPSVYASKSLTRLAYWGDSLICLLTGKNPVITRDTINASGNQVFFSNEKIRKAIGISFKPIDQAIRETAEKFLKEFNQRK